MPIDPYHHEYNDLMVPPVAVIHRESEYDSRGFAILARMQRDHFWYRGRHRLLLDIVHRHVGPIPSRLVDLGGGCGGWVDYLERHKRFPVAELALADSSEEALRFAESILSPTISRYRIDLLNLQWNDRWEVAFLLDVLEHIPDHEKALRQVFEALTPGGLLIVTVPAFQAFWTWNDDLVHYQRRYTKSSLSALARGCGFQVLEARYFMFFLTPLCSPAVCSRHRGSAE